MTGIAVNPENVNTSSTSSTSLILVTSTDASGRV